MVLFFGVQDLLQYAFHVQQEQSEWRKGLCDALHKYRVGLGYP